MSGVLHAIAHEMKRALPIVCMLLAVTAAIAWNAASGGRRADDADMDWPVGDATNVSSGGAVSGRSAAGRLASETAQSKIAWRVNWTDAVTEAKQDGKLLLVYVSLDPETCPPCAWVERNVFARPEAVRLTERAVPIKSELGQGTAGMPGDLLARLRVGAAPALVVMTHDGAILHRQVGGLFPTYDRRGQVAGDAPEGLLTIEDLAGVVSRAVRRDADDRRRIAELELRGDVDSLAELAGIHTAREHYRIAQGELERALVLDADVETRMALAGVYERTGRTRDAMQLLAVLIEENDDHPRLLDWRFRLTKLRLARLDRSTERGQRYEGVALLELEGIAALASHGAQYTLEDRIQLEIASMYAARDQLDELASVLDWFTTRSASHELDAPLRWELSLLARAAGRPGEALRHLEQLVLDHPESIEAQRLKHGALDAMRSEIGHGAG